MRAVDVLVQPELSGEAGPSHRRGLRAVVLGAGVGGLLAAHVACRHFEEVTVLEKDAVLAGRVEDEGVEQSRRRRAGVPQFPHVHVLLMGGLHAAERLLPGFTQELRQAGGLDQDLGTDIHLHDWESEISFARASTCMKVVGMSRRLLEQTLRDRVLRENKGSLVLRTGAEAGGLSWSEDHTHVTGLELAGGEVVPADLVIDASGRHSRLPLWLEESGWTIPKTELVDAQLSYASRTVKLPEGQGKQEAIVIYGRPSGLRGGFLLPQENGTAVATLYGLLGEKPPADEQGFVSYAASLPDKSVHRVLLKATPISPIVRYAGAKNELCLYHEMPMPPGLVVVGDSAMQLNPIYAQGMSCAALGVTELDAALGRALRGSGRGAAGTAGKASSVSASTSEAQQLEGLRHLACTFQKDLFASISLGWMMATSEDLRYPGVRVEGVAKPPRLLSAYIDLVARASLRDLPTFETFWMVGHFVRPMWTLFTPGMVWQVAKQAGREAVTTAEHKARGLLYTRVLNKAMPY